MSLVVLSISTFEYVWYMNIGRFQLHNKMDKNLHFILKYGYLKNKYI